MCSDSTCSSREDGVRCTDAQECGTGEHSKHKVLSKDYSPLSQAAGLRAGLGLRREKLSHISPSNANFNELYRAWDVHTLSGTTDAWRVYFSQAIRLSSSGIAYIYYDAVWNSDIVSLARVHCCRF